MYICMFTVCMYVCMYMCMYLCLLCVLFSLHSCMQCSSYPLHAYVLHTPPHSMNTTSTVQSLYSNEHQHTHSDRFFDSNRSSVVEETGVRKPDTTKTHSHTIDSNSGSFSNSLPRMKANTHVSVLLLLIN